MNIIWKRNLFLILTICTGILIGSNVLASDTLFESYTDTGNSNTIPDDYLYAGQSFTASNDYCLTSVELLGYKSGTINNATLSIRATASNKPTGSDLTVKVLASTTMPTSNGWIEFVFDTPITVDSGTMYALVLTANASAFNWAINNVGTYSGGGRSESTNGTDWTDDYYTRDRNFKIYGILGNCEEEATTTFVEGQLNFPEIMLMFLAISLLCSAIYYSGSYLDKGIRKGYSKV